MNSHVGKIIEALINVWSEPKVPTYLQGSAFNLAARCSGKPAIKTIVCKKVLPVELRDFWNDYCSVVLFEDVGDGQWGLALLDYESSNRITRRENRERPFDTLRGDRVIGQFIGDSELLVIRCDNAKSDFGHVLVSLPTSGREEWYHVGNSFSEFLAEYIACEGQKYWTPHYARGNQPGPT